MSIRLSERLKTLARLVPADARVIDVGTDHAKLPVWLAQTGRASHIWAADIREGPLQSAKELVEKTGTGQCVELRQTDGLHGFQRTDGDVIVIAGMGGETIVHILSEVPWTKDGVMLILAPQTKQAVLRRFLAENGYVIESESLSEDAGRIYPILTVRGGDPVSYSEAEFFCGRFADIVRDPLFPVLLGQLRKRAASAAPFDEKARSLTAEYDWMKERLERMPAVADILRLLTEKAPLETKLGFDNVGLLVGRSDRKVQTVLTALDITDDVIEEAVSEGADLIVSHHPLFFELKSLTDGSWTGERVLRLAEQGIAAICMHTNLDAARGGVNDALLAVLGLSYAGELDEETMIGRIGCLPDAVPLSDFLKTVKNALHANGLRYHDAGRPVSRVAVCGGSGGGEVALAYAAGCDTYVTADIKYDPFLEAAHLGMNLIDADHFCTENVVVPVLAGWMKAVFPELRVLISQTHTQTAQFYIS